MLTRMGTFSLFGGSPLNRRGANPCLGPLVVGFPRDPRIRLPTDITPSAAHSFLPSPGMHTYNVASFVRAHAFVLMPDGIFR